MITGLKEKIKMNIVFWIGRIIVGVYLLFNAFNHFSQLNMMSGYAQSKGVPAPKLAVLGSGVLLLIGGLSVLFWQYLFWGMIALALFLIPVTMMMHNFWTIEDQQAKMNEMVGFMKNMALLGFALIVLAQLA